MQITLKEQTVGRVKQLLNQLQIAEQQIGQAIDNIVVTVCEENEIDLNEYRPQLSKDFTTLTFEKIEPKESNLSVVSDVEEQTY